MSITIQDIADLAKVSKGTVSRVNNGGRASVRRHEKNIKSLKSWITAVKQPIHELGGSGTLGERWKKNRTIWWRFFLNIQSL